MKNTSKILITYKSQYGATKKVSQIMCNEIKNHFYSVTILPISKVANLDDFDVVLVGSPIQFDKWRNESISFVKENADILKDKKVAFFYTCMTLSIKSEKSQKTAEQYTNSLRIIEPKIIPIDVKGFAGAVKFSSIPFFIRYPLMLILNFKGAQQGDFIDQVEIKKWISSLVSKLK